MTEFNERLNVSWWALRVGLGVGPIITGIDKYFNKLADWSMYLSPLATKACRLAPQLSCMPLDSWRLLLDSSC